MIRIIKQELNISPYLKKKITWSSKYTNINIIIENGTLIRLEPTNIAYVEPHKVIINKNYIEIKSICNIPMPIDLNVAYAEYLHQ